MKTYSELVKLQTFLERYRYLKLNGKVCEETFGYNRYLNQILYTSKEWRQLRPYIIDRDKACDIFGKRNIFIHHINPITLKDINDRNPIIFDPENLICVTKSTHDAIHYGDESHLPIILTERKPNDLCPWK